MERTIARQLDVAENRSSELCQDYLLPDWNAALRRDTGLNAPLIQLSSSGWDVSKKGFKNLRKSHCAQGYTRCRSRTCGFPFAKFAFRKRAKQEDPE